VILLTYHYDLRIRYRLAGAHRSSRTRPGADHAQRPRRRPGRRRADDARRRDRAGAACVGSALGVSALLATSAAAYATLKLVGVAYLLYLGVRMLLSARKPPEPEQEARGGRPFLQGSCRTR
jgi:LysE type translocator